MGGAGALLGPAEPVRTEIVHGSRRTRVTRMFFAGGTVIRKEPLGPDAVRRLRHEVAMLARLRGVAGVAQLAEGLRYPGSVVLADAGDTSLAGLAKPLAADDLIRLAVPLARAVAGMHRREVIHRDITPANIVVSADGALCLVDFALATSLAEIRLEFTHHTEIMGTLAYLAPEQTGRTGRPVDQRADLYALGAALYELATGEPPFGRGPASRLLHDHLARVPVPPAAVVRDVPESLSAIIMHLLEKEPDNRYQSADGLVLRPGAAPGRPRGSARGRAAGRRARRPGPAAATVAAGGARRGGRGAARHVHPVAGRPVRGRADQRCAGRGEDSAGRRAADGGRQRRRLARDGQVRPVPAGPGI